MTILNFYLYFLDDLLFSLVAAVPIYIEYIKNHPEALKVCFFHVYFGDKFDKSE